MMSMINVCRAILTAYLLTLIICKIGFEPAGPHWLLQCVIMGGMVALCLYGVHRFGDRRWW